MDKTMPLHPDSRKTPGCPKEIPMALLSEEMAQRNHGQSLKRLAERGGLSAQEIICNMDNVGLFKTRLSDLQAVAELNKRLTALTRSQADKPTGLRWVKASERLPKQDGQICVRRLGVDYSAAYVRTQHDGKRVICSMATQKSVWPNWKNTLEWLDESTPDETATLRAQLTAAQAEIDRVAGEAKESDEAATNLRNGWDAARKEAAEYRKALVDGDRILGHYEILPESPYHERIRGLISQYPPTQKT